LQCNDEYSKVEIRDDGDLHYILDSIVKGGSSVICEVYEEYEEDTTEYTLSPSPSIEVGAVARRSLKPGEIIRPRTPDNLRRIRNTLMRDGFEKLKQRSETSHKVVLPRGLEDELKTAAKKRKSTLSLLEDVSRARSATSSPATQQAGVGAGSEAVPVKRLVMQVVMEGKKTWENDIWKWAKDVQRIFAYNVRMIRLVFNIVEATYEHKHFTEAMNFAKNSPLPASMANVRDYIKVPSPQELSDWLIEIGFSVRFCKYSVEDAGTSTSSEIIEPETIIKPAHIPIRYLLKSMLIVLK